MINQMEIAAKKSSIFLIGFMGAGKSTIGKKLAHRLGLQFFDLDKLIEAKAGCSISDIFKFLGEDAFRQLEQSCLQEIVAHDHILLAAGGGTPCFFNNIEIMKAKGLVIYIELPELVLYERLVKAKKVRPSVRGMNEVELKAFIEKQLLTRKSFYEQADLTMNGLSVNLTEIIEQIQLLN
jgi:shikimate kinase